MVEVENNTQKKDDVIQLLDETKEKLQQATMVGIVVAIGEECYKKHPAYRPGIEPIKVGDKILFQRYAGYSRVINGKKYVFLRDDNPIAILEDTDELEYQ